MTSINCIVSVGNSTTTTLPRLQQLLSSTTSSDATTSSTASRYWFWSSSTKCCTTDYITTSPDNTTSSAAFTYKHEILKSQQWTASHHNSDKWILTKRQEYSRDLNLLTHQISFIVKEKVCWRTYLSKHIYLDMFTLSIICNDYLLYFDNIAYFICSSSNMDIRHCVYKHNYMIGKLCLFYKVMSIMMLVYKVFVLLTNATEYYLFNKYHYHVYTAIRKLTMYVYYCTITFPLMTYTNNYSGTLYTI